MSNEPSADGGTDALYDYNFCPVAEFNEIRILKLRGGYAEDEIQCTLSACTLNPPAGKIDTTPNPSLQQKGRRKTSRIHADGSSLKVPARSNKFRGRTRRIGPERHFQNRQSSKAGSTNSESPSQRRPDLSSGGHSGPNYEALSYHWGDDEVSVAIQIFSTREYPYKLMIRPNLYDALKRLRLPDRARSLWIDAICIDQSNVDERNHQVSQMATIYRKASQVCVWLGTDCSDSSMAFDFSNRLSNLKEFDRLASSADAMIEWKALLSVMKRSWFNRRWVVQEIALARRATIYCGEKHLEWDVFANAVALFNDEEYRNRTISNTIMKTTPGYRPDDLGEIKFLGASRLVEITTNLFRESSDGRQFDSLLNLDALVSNLSVCKASKPHDTIYALLALAKNTMPLAKSKSEVPTPPSTINPDIDPRLALIAKKMAANYRLRRFFIDYDKPFYTVCKEFLERTITGQGSLDIICRPWIPQDVPDSQYPSDWRPSWLLTTADAPYGAREDGGFTRVNADSLVGIAGLRRKNYSASGDYRVTEGWRFGNTEKDNGSLYANGFVVDEIASKCPFAPNGTILDEWLETGGWTDRTALPPDPLWRTLVGNRGQDGQNPPAFYRRACSEALRQSAIGGHISTTTIIHQSNSSAVRNFMRRTQEVMWERRLIKTKYDHLGLVRKDVKKRDLVCILYGCSVPVILRGHDEREYDAVEETSTSEGEEQMETEVTNQGERPKVYEFLGECYIHGIMDGEAFDKARQRNPEEPGVRIKKVNFRII